MQSLIIVLYGAALGCLSFQKVHHIFKH